MTPPSAAAALPIPDPAPSDAVESRRRHSAGEDPGKRDQILDGARTVFLEGGFDGASMNDVCRIAGVSKGTLYVYFANKEELFAALIRREREHLFLGLDQVLAADLPLDERLGRYGRALAAILCSEPVVRAQRSIIGIAARLPALASQFHEEGAKRTQGSLRRALEQEAGAGRLSMPDAGLAAVQFIELVTAGLWRPRLFGAAPTPPSAREIAARVDSAVAMFLAAYAAGRSARV